MTPPHVIITFQLTDDEARRAREALIVSDDPMGNPQMLRIFITIPIGLVAGYLIANIFGVGVSPSLVSPLRTAIIIGSGITAILLTDGILLRRMYSTISATRPITVHLAQQGLAVDRSGLAVRIPWHRVRRIEETPDLFILYVSKSPGLVLPKRSTSKRSNRMAASGSSEARTTSRAAVGSVRP